MVAVEVAVEMGKDGDRTRYKAILYFGETEMAI